MRGRENVATGLASEGRSRGSERDTMGRRDPSRRRGGRSFLRWHTPTAGARSARSGPGSVESAGLGARVGVDRFGNDVVQVDDRFRLVFDGFELGRFVFAWCGVGGFGLEV